MGKLQRTQGRRNFTYGFQGRCVAGGAKMQLTESRVRLGHGALKR